MGGLTRSPLSPTLPSLRSSHVQVFSGLPTISSLYFLHFHLCLMNSYFAHFKCFCIIRILFALSSSSSSFSGPQTLLSFPIVTLFLSRLMHISALSPSCLCKVCLALYASCLTENSQPVSL